MSESKKSNKNIGFWFKQRSIANKLKQPVQKDPIKNLTRKRRRSSIAYDNTKYDSLPMCGYDVRLPPGLSLYPSQKLIITKVLSSLKYRQNVLAESPTGSGKTLALLASTCSWLAQHRADRDNARKNCPVHGESPATAVKDEPAANMTQMDIKTEPCDSLSCVENAISNRILTYEDEFKDDFLKTNTVQSAVFDESSVETKAKECICLPRVRIYYGTRTHKQIAQVVKEFGRLPYAGILRHTILGSRDQLCVNGEAIDSNDTTSYCKELLKFNGPGCVFRANMRGKLENPSVMRRHTESYVPIVFDIEDLMDGLSAGSPPVCPYFTATRVLTCDADIIFCPFTYLVDPVIRNSSDVHVKNSVIILDEAHNIEDTCRSSASFTFHEKEISDSMNSCKEKERLVQDALIDLQGEEEAAEELITRLLSLSRSFALTIGFLEDLWIWFKHVAEDAACLPKDTYTGARSLTRTWSFLRQSLGEGFLRDSLLSPEYSPRYTAIMDALNCFTSTEDEKQQSAQQSGGQYRPSATALVLIEKWMYFQKFFGIANYMDTYRVNATVEEATSSFVNQSSIISDSSGPRNLMYNSQDDPTTWLDSTQGYGNLEPVVPGCRTSISLWCMSPALTFMDAFCEARSVILASGTLSPMETLKTELGVEFKSQLEGRQVIPCDRIFASVVPSGGSGNLINCSRDGLARPYTIRDIAEVIRDVCEIVPHGVLCFVSSYAVLSSIKSYMQSQGIISEINKRKKVFEEPRVSSRMNEIIEQFSNAIKFPKCGQNGALMFAVFRGKISEGLDFADDLARAVISIGIPYPNHGDAQVVEKRKYNDENSKMKHILDGQDWYKSQAYRALNQALGRCLRHKNDWGSLILLDHRLSEQASTNARMGNLAPSSRVSTWIRDQLVVYNSNYSGFLSDLESFVNRLVSESPGKG